jgi:hypothetical protein
VGAGLLARLLRIDVEGMLGSRNSSTGCGAVWMCLLGVSWRNTRIGEDGFEWVSREQLLVIQRVAMFA